MSNTQKLSPTTYGRWVSIQLDLNDAHFFTIRMYRHKPIREDIIKAMNDLYDGIDVQLTVESMPHYDEVQAIIAQELEKRKAK
jgi:hypothetical protein